MWFTDDELRAFSRGEIRKPDHYNYRTYLPEAGGLYCVSIFGPVDWKEGERHMSTDHRRDHFGHIELPELVARRNGPSRRVILIVPPEYRRFRLLSATEAREHLRKRRAHLVELSKTDQWPYCDDSLENVLAEEGLSDEQRIESCDEGLVEPILNRAYRSVINHARRLHRLCELNAPAKVLAEVRESLKTACARLDAELLASSDLPQLVQTRALGRTP